MRSAMNTIMALVALGLGEPPAAPLVCPAPVAAKGDVKGGPPLTHTFDLSHQGSVGTITITRIEASCGCLRRTLSSDTLQPGQTAKLTLEVNTLTQPDGPNRWQIVVGYAHDLPAQPGVAASRQLGELLLVATATLTREVSVTPAQVGISTTGEASQILTVTDRRAKPLTVLKAGSSSPFLTATIAPRGNGPSQSITLKLSADAPVGHRDESVVLLTDDPVYPEFHVPVRVLKRVAGGVAAAPESVAVRFAAGQSEVSTIVQLRAADGKLVGVATAVSDHPGVLVKWSEGVGPVAAVRITVSGAAVTQSGETRVRIHLADPVVQEVVVPVSWSGGTGK